MTLLTNTGLVKYNKSIVWGRHGVSCICLTNLEITTHLTSNPYNTKLYLNKQWDEYIQVDGTQHWCFLLQIFNPPPTDMIFRSYVPLAERKMLAMFEVLSDNLDQMEQGVSMLSKATLHKYWYRLQSTYWHFFYSLYFNANQSQCKRFNSAWCI